MKPTPLMVDLAAVSIAGHFGYELSDEEETYNTAYWRAIASDALLDALEAMEMPASTRTQEER